MILDKTSKRTSRCRDTSIGSGSIIDTNCETDAQVIMMIMPDIQRIQSIIIITFASGLGHHTDYGIYLGE